MIDSHFTLKQIQKCLTFYLVLICLTPIQAFSNSRCQSALSSPTDSHSAPTATGRQRPPARSRVAADRPAPVDSIFQSTTPIVVTSGRHQAPLTFSFDSEIPFREAFRSIRQNETSLARTRQSLDEAFTSSLPSFNRQQLRQIFPNESDQRINHFGLARGVDRSRSSFNMTEFNPSYFETILAYSGFQIRNAFGAAFVEHLQNLNGMETHFTIEEANVEIQHISFDEVPSIYFQTIRNRLHRDFPMANTHLHLGIPEFVSHESAIAIAAAVELNSVLQLLRDWSPGDAPLAFSSASHFHPQYNDGGRGPVRLTAHRFVNRSHDLEIRQYPDIDTGLAWVNLAAQLAVKHDSLVQVRVPKKIAVSQQVGNIAGAFAYLAKLLEIQDPVENRELVNQINSLLQRTSVYLDETHLPELQAFESEHQLIEKITPDLFIQKPKSE